MPGKMHVDCHVSGYHGVVFINEIFVTASKPTCVPCRPIFYIVVFYVGLNSHVLFRLI